MKIHDLIWKETAYTWGKLQDLRNAYWQESEEKEIRFQRCETSDDKYKIRLGRSYHLCVLSWKSEFDVLAQTPRKGMNIFLSWLIESWAQFIALQFGMAELSLG